MTSYYFVVLARSGSPQWYRCRDGDVQELCTCLTVPEKHRVYALPVCTPNTHRHAEISLFGRHGRRRCSGFGEHSHWLDGLGGDTGMTCDRLQGVVCEGHHWPDPAQAAIGSRRDDEEWVRNSDHVLWTKVEEGSVFRGISSCVLAQ